MKKTIRSPEFFPKNVLQRSINTSLYNVFRRLKSSVLQVAYKKNAYGNKFDWDWRKINYSRVALVNYLVKNFGDCDYLEIGCATNQLFNSVPALRKVGVDPASGGNVRATSDEFFSKNSSNFDVVFIDGLHTYEQVRKDVINAIKVLKPGGYVALHDMLPRTWIEEHVPVVTHEAWTGDVWKIAFELNATPGIDFKIVKIDYGVGVFRVTKSDAPLADMREILDTKRFAYLYENVGELPVIEWDEFIKWANSEDSV